MPKRNGPINSRYASMGEAWKSWPSLTVTLFNLPNTISTKALWKAFSMQGNIASIDIFEDRNGNPISKGRIRFWYVSFLFFASPIPTLYHSIAV